jgi:hypothetical protein
VPPVAGTCKSGFHHGLKYIPDTIEAFTDMIYAIAKKVASPALTSVRNLDPFLSCLCPENSSLNRRPMALLATAMFVFSTYRLMSIRTFMVI